MNKYILYADDNGLFMLKAAPIYFIDNGWGLAVMEADTDQNQLIPSNETLLDITYLELSYICQPHHPVV